MSKVVGFSHIGSMSRAKWHGLHRQGLHEACFLLSGLCVQAESFMAAIAPLHEACFLLSGLCWLEADVRAAKLCHKRNHIRP